MSLKVSVEKGTGAGTRPAFTDGHGPRCACSRCEARRFNEALALCQKARDDARS